MKSLCCLPLVGSRTHWLQVIFQPPKHPAALFPCPLLAGGTEYVSPWLLCLFARCLLKPGGPAHLLDASPCVSLEQGKLHAWERRRNKHSINREPKRFDFLQNPALPLRRLYLKMCMLLPSFLFAGVPSTVRNAWLYSEGRGDCIGVYGEGLEQQHQVDAGANRKETCSVN